jgi:MOSC domain-containing protein YiiM
VTFPATPCVKNARWFVDRDFNRMAHEREPGISRMYGTVVRPGHVATGDAVHLEG